MSDIASELDEVREVRGHIVGASTSSHWIFVEVTMRSGLTGWGEATTDGADDYVLAAVAAYRARLGGRSLRELRGLSHSRLPVYPAPLTEGAVLSALEQAEWDIRARHLGAPIWELLGGSGEPVPFYWNLNRGIGSDRSPERFAASAAAAGFRGVPVKIAPFDGMSRTDQEETCTKLAVDEALARIGAVRDALPAGHPMMVDCHARFTARTARWVLKELAPFDPYWVEAPVSELDLEGWHDVRRDTSLRLAGGEMLRTPRDFGRFLRRSGVDVVMPDVKYCGGVSGLLRIGALADAFDVLVSPHNPSGPVGSLASAHGASALPGFMILELPWGESDVRPSLLKEEIDGHQLRLPTSPGLGGAPDRSVMAEHPPGTVRRTVDDWIFGPDRPTRPPRPTQTWRKTV